MDQREYGAAIATNTCFILNMVVSDVIIRKQASTTFKNMIFFYDKSCLEELGPYLNLGFFGMLMVCFEWWVFEILAVFAGKLGVIELST